jgi:Na+-transporting NADH:ubiquinone oxidoreductase subunit NqrC
LGLPSGNKYDSASGQGLYFLHVGKNILYVGRGDAPTRLNTHANTLGKSHLFQETIFNNNLTKAEAKFLEQRIMDLNGGVKSTDPLTNLLNKIRSYSPSNPDACSYDIAGDSAKWADDILKDTRNRFKILGL